MDTIRAWVLIVIVGAALAFFGWNWLHSPVDRRRAQVRSAAIRIDVNSADADTLAALPRVGQRLGGRIVEHRQAHGPFNSTDELKQVKGVGVKTLARIRPWIQCSPPPAK